ncbi:BglG family transcription antiterminator LicT [Cronobacter dublinensis]|uniref:PRD domain-containing protein n=1 Tax=Cronobacter dublinensis TaxID=413497 RepID=A0A9Q4T212_9ENTR|nr:PRD domain-containing protein [Cronobacter dublinensis]EGT5662017.1 PRD domain-containing protein [Cronobacter dublinensis subsp. dublinensis]EGT4359160.1 PRD domain-containing protein [Cronobacter dublinensis]EGT5670191.1 PRD domain-containing protein [Cronobacter dublinensis subsp. dublinensis]EGT5674450.1 PRD domain-containing protein [Cronobacter dublinensis subsp. dublinensis]EGT5678435.1 PRD domain-containing protein [Cronobacter dublinensis subsp. dublinensis]
MIIKQILNNNVVSAVDERGQEVIVTGRGLGFNAHVGEAVAISQVEKTFRLHDDTVSARFKVLLDEVPVEIVQLTDDIVALARQTPGLKLSEGIYVTLADHLYYALARSQQGQEIANPLQWEVRHFYQDEYAIGRQALALIAARTGVLMPDSEACSIALHIVNAGLNDPKGKINDITRLIYQIQNIVKYWFAVGPDEQSLNYQRFITHVKFFAQRVIEGQRLENDDHELFAMVQQRYKNTVACVEAISDFVEKNYRHAMTHSEKLYLTVHIDNVIHRLAHSL